MDKTFYVHKQPFFLFERDGYSIERGFYKYVNLIFTGHFYKKNMKMYLHGKNLSII